MRQPLVLSHLQDDASLFKRPRNARKRAHAHLQKHPNTSNLHIQVWGGVHSRSLVSMGTLLYLWGLWRNVGDLNCDSARTDMLLYFLYAVTNFFKAMCGVIQRTWPIATKKSTTVRQG